MRGTSKVGLFAAKVRLHKPLREHLRSGHPWVYRDAVEGVVPQPGTVTTIVDRDDRFVARGLAEQGPIAVRVFTTVDEPLDEALLTRRIGDAVALRDTVVPPDVTAYRLVHGENDRLPGLVCDVYGPYASIQLDGTAIVACKDLMLDVLRPVLERRGIRGVLVRSGRRGEKQVEHAWGEAPPPKLTVHEQGLALSVDLWKGQKTGLFLDHRTSRRRVRDLAQGRRVLDLYAYIGGFSAGAGLGGASQVVTVDVAAGAIAQAEATWASNGLSPERHERVAADVPTFLQAAAERRERFDLIVADPPSFAPNEKSKHVALRSYVKLHKACLELVNPGGYYLAASCSSHIDRAAFDESIVEGARKARRVLQVLERWGAPADHPRLLAFPEGDYLKVTLLRVLG